jgi:hypothetical protein
MSRRISLSLVALLAAVAACDRPAPTANEDTSPPATGSQAQSSTERAAIDRLARRLARALADPAFRARLKAELDRSPYIEHKVQLQSFLRAADGVALKEIARLNGAPEATLRTETDEAIALEIYFPVPAHREAWSGGAELLVASAREDREAPVAYDVLGHRQVLSAEAPPALPVLAVVPVETEFSPNGEIAGMECQESCGGGGGGGGTTAPSPPPGLYMTYSHFVQDFEGWLKGDPEFEFHILGQSGISDSLKDY